MISRILPLLVLHIMALCVHAQQTRIYTDPLGTYHRAKELYQKEQYSLAYPIFREISAGLREPDQGNYRIAYEEVEYYSIACALRQNEASAESLATAFADLQSDQALRQKMNFQLGEFYFRKQQYRDAVSRYEKVNTDNLSGREAGDLRFHQGYGYFTLQQFERAKPLLNAVRQMPESGNRPDADYYYGFIAFRDREYNEAMNAFRSVESHPEYGKVVPFYIATILFRQGKRDEALAYAENALKKRGSGLYDAELRRLTGLVYFEKRQFAKALPNLEAYMSSAEDPGREDIYRLSYSYYDAGQYGKAIEGFRRLTDGKDSLSQSAMYLLGDAFLKTGQKANARNAFSFSAGNSSNLQQREVSLFHYGKLSYELGYQDVAINGLRDFLTAFPRSGYANEARELMGSILAGTNNYREALELLESLRDPSENARRLLPKVLYGRAMELINDDRLSQADQLLERISREPDQPSVIPPAHFWRGEIAYRQNRLDDAIGHYNRYLGGTAYQSGEVSPKHARYNLGYCHLRKENYKTAQGFFDQVYRTAGPDMPELEQDAYLRSADCSFMNRDFARARTMYNTAVSQSWPAGDYATYQLAMIAGVTSPADKIRTLQGLDRKFPSSELIPFMQMEIASTYMADEKFSEAIPYLQRVLGSAGATSLKPRAYLRLGIAQYNLDRNNEALATYKKLIAEYPNAPETDEALESARAIYMDEGRIGEYVDLLKRSGRTVSTVQQDSLAYAAAESKYASGDLNASIAAFSGYINQYPGGSRLIDALYLRSEIYNKRKDFTNAYEGYARVADLSPNRYAEQAARQAARISFFERKDYAAAEKYFNRLKQLTGDRELRLDAMRGLLRSQYQLRKYEEGSGNAGELLNEKSIGTDDRVIASMMMGKYHQGKAEFLEAIDHFRTAVSLSKAAFAAEARYEIASCYFMLDDLKNAEKAAFEAVNKSGSYDLWITRSYILLGDVFYRQKDFFNAKATWQSVMDNTRTTELRNEAKARLDSLKASDK